MTTAVPREAPPAGVPSDGPAPARPTLILASICISYFMVILGNSIVFTGLPQIRSDIADRSGAALMGAAVLLTLATLTVPAFVLPSRDAHKERS
ncbi:hypothetical protein [Streptomyces sp. NPDC020298]|uniref:hypothetical protein n=1 Tax=unclassified Streptomyces TaxID=2593676 RepID=UPI0033F55F74